eukprot:COSAG01_NODE_115_length_25561_cov_103.183450_7_plen_41_part_00
MLGNAHWDAFTEQIHKMNHANKEMVSYSAYRPWTPSKQAL